MNQEIYPSESLGTKRLFLLSLLTWWRAMKVFFWPIVITTLFYFLFNVIAYYVKVPSQDYVVAFFSYLFMAFFIFMAYCQLHTLWKGGAVSWMTSCRLCFSRFFPPFFASLIILVVAFFLIFVGIFLAKMIAPYTHVFGQLASAATLAAIGLLALVWTMVTLYAPFYYFRDNISIRQAFKLSMAANSLSKTLFTYMPIVGLVILFLLTNLKMPWFHFTQHIWIYALIQFVLRWVIGAWVLNALCLAMNDCDYRFLSEDSRYRKKRADRKARKAEKQGQKDECDRDEGQSS